ncbi:MAG: T9SS type A sorting domain-containing protein [Bacteroidota bacterium]
MKLKILLLLLGLHRVLFAQNFTEVTQFSSFEGVRSSSIAFADVDGVGDEDVLITGRNNSFTFISKLYTNDGMGSFNEVMGTPFEGVWAGSIAFADVDGDGDEDVLITGVNSSNTRISKLYTNDGMGSFSEVMGTPFDGVVDGSIAFADVDGDGDEDVLITGRNTSNARISKLYTNDGMGSYSEVMGTPFDGVDFGSIAFADVDSDGDEDVLITGLIGPASISKLYTNDGMGSFNEMTSTSFENVFISSVAFADVDGDGDEDVLMTGEKSCGLPDTKLYINDSMGSFSEMADTPFDNVLDGSIAFADVDGDGDEDVLITGLSISFSSVTKLYTNDGMGSFSEMMDTPFDGVFSSSIVFADVDGDGDEDVLITGEDNSNISISRLYINDGVTSSADNLFANLSLSLTPFPNPAISDNLSISFESTESNPAIIRLYDLNGRLISQQEEFVRIGEQAFVVDIASLAIGSYFIQLESGKKRGVAKFVIK